MNSERRNLDAVPRYDLGHLKVVLEEAYLDAVAEIERLRETPQMTQREFRAVLDWYMCSDPWPVNDMGGQDTHAIVTEWLSQLAKADGWADWVDAYHRVPR